MLAQLEAIAKAEARDIRRRRLPSAAFLKHAPKSPPPEIEEWVHATKLTIRALTKIPEDHKLYDFILEYPMLGVLFLSYPCTNWHLAVVVLTMYELLADKFGGARLDVLKADDRFEDVLRELVRVAMGAFANNTSLFPHLFKPDSTKARFVVESIVDELLAKGFMNVVEREYLLSGLGHEELTGLKADIGHQTKPHPVLDAKQLGVARLIELINIEVDLLGGHKVCELVKWCAATPAARLHTAHPHALTRVSSGRPRRWLHGEERGTWAFNKIDFTTVAKDAASSSGDHNAYDRVIDATQEELDMLPYFFGDGCVHAMPCTSPPTPTDPAHPSTRCRPG